MNKMLFLILISVINIFSVHGFTESDLLSCLNDAEAAFTNYNRPQDYKFQVSGPVNEVIELYDYIIVGASNCGIKAAATLKQNLPHAKILIINAGSLNLSSCLSKVPGFQKYLPFISDAHMGLQSLPSNKYFLGLNNNTVNIRSSKLGAGDSAIDNMAFGKLTDAEVTEFSYFVERCKTIEEDNWVDNINETIRLMENTTISNADPYCHGTKGPIFTSVNTYSSKAAKEFLNGSTDDYNCVNNVGRGPLQVIRNDTNRWTSLDAFNLTNVTILENALVTKINVQKCNLVLCSFLATGVQYVKNNTLYSVKANKEVILSAGAIQSAQILQNSGIGNCSQLQNLTIPCVKNLTSVGQSQKVRPKVRLLLTTNCTQNDYITREVIQEYITNKTGLLINGGKIEGINFVNIKNPNSTNPDVQISISYVNCSDNILIKAINFNDSIAKEWCNSQKFPNGTVMFTLSLIQSNSTISTSLKSSSISDFPNITTNLADEDLKKLADAISYVRDNITLSFKECSAKIEPQIPSLEDANKSRYENDLNFVRYTVTISSKISGGCDIGKVVDSKMKVIDSCNLRVCDSCALPILPSRSLSSILTAMGTKLSKFAEDEYCNPPLLDPEIPVLI